VLIFVVLGTMMMGLATPTEAGAMGAVGAIVLAAIHSKDFSTTGRKVLIIGAIAGGIGTIIGMFATDGLIFALDKSTLTDLEAEHPDIRRAIAALLG